MKNSNGLSRRRGFRHQSTVAAARRAVRLGLPLVFVAILLGGASPPRNLQEALQAQRSLVARDPGNAELLNDLGNLLALTRDLEGAEEAYLRALNVEPENPTVLYNLALVLQEQGETKQTRNHLLTLLEHNPNHAWGHYQLGTVYAAQNNRSKALEHYERAFALDRSLVDPKVNPHIVENRLVTEALLQLYLTQAPSTQAPRIYQDPSSIAAFLLPAETEPAGSNETDSMLPAAPSSHDTGQYRATFQPGVGVSQGWDSAPAVDTPIEESPPAEDDRDTRNGSAAGSAPGWSGTVIVPPAGEYEGSTFGQESTRGGASAAPPVRRITVEDLPQDTRDSGGQFRPGTSSTGRLELELLPAEPSSSTVPAS